MEKISYFARINDENYVEVYVCDEIPDFIHAVKYDNVNNIEIYFSEDSDWTPDLEKQAFEETLQGFIHHPDAIAV